MPARRESKLAEGKDEEIANRRERQVVDGIWQESRPLASVSSLEQLRWVFPFP